MLSVLTESWAIINVESDCIALVAVDVGFSTLFVVIVGVGVEELDISVFLELISVSTTFLTLERVRFCNVEHRKKNTVKIKRNIYLESSFMQKIRIQFHSEHKTNELCTIITENLAK